MKHEHEVKHHTVTRSGKVYEVCECGATRISDLGKSFQIDWHACELCSTEADNADNL